MKTINQSLILVFLILFSSCNQPTVKKQSEKGYTPKISVVFPATIDAFKQLEQGLKEICGEKFEITFYSAEGDADKFETAIQSALLNHPQYLITIGTQITNTAFGPKFKNNLPVVIAGAISSPEMIEPLVSIGLEPPRKSSVAIVSDSPKENIFDLFGTALKSFLPKAKVVGIIYNPGEINSKVTSDNIRTVLRQRKITVKEGVINSPEDVDKVTERLLLQGIEAMIIPHDKNAVMKATSIVKRCDEKQVPVFSLDDGTVKKDGVCIGVSVNYRTIGELIGQALLKIEGKEVKAENLPIVSVQSARIYVNTRKVHDFGLENAGKLNSLIENY